MMRRVQPGDDGGASAIDERWLDAIDARIAYRGPDGCGRFRDRTTIAGPDGDVIVEVAFVHRRLSIIDLEGGAQPMVSERGRDDDEGLIAVVFNGCIYNHGDLRRALEADGHTFVTDHSDTEVLIHGYRQWGEDLESRLEGMYACAIWDRDRARLTLMRDRFGEKPLYVRSGHAGEAGTVAFASDAMALAQLDEQGSEHGRCLPVDDVRWTGSYLQLGYNWQGRTVYNGFAARTGDGSGAATGVVNSSPGLVDALPHLLRSGSFDDAPGRPAAADDRRPVPISRSMTDDAITDAVESLLDQAVQARLESDVPIGCLLSGGVDSSLVTAFARRHRPDVRTYCLRMPEDAYDESHHAERVAEFLAVQHTTLDPGPDAAADLVHLIRTLGQPFGDSSILPTYWICRAAQSHAKVLLSGDGGDELFAGYDRYVAAQHLWRVRGLLTLLPKWVGARAHPKHMRHRIGRLITIAREYPAAGVLAFESIFSQDDIQALLGGAHDAAAPGMPRFHARHHHVSPAAALRQIDLQSYLPDDLLCKVDTASMACGIEVRCPMLDRTVTAAALQLPMRRLMPRGERKSILRRIARRHLPPAVVDRPKMGFAIPIDSWFRTDVGGMQSLLLERLGGEDAFGPLDLDPAVVERLMNDHIDGRAQHGQRLFCLLTLAIWAQEVLPLLDSAACAASDPPLARPR